MTETSAVLRIAPPGTARALARLTGAQGTGPGRSGGPSALVERNVRVYRAGWVVLISGFFEPLFYLLSLGVGLSRLVGQVEGPGGHLMTYTAFVAPAMLASSAMNGAVFDATFNIFFKLKYAKLYDAILATPMSTRDVAVGEIGWALMRGGFYSAMFLVVMLALGLVSSWWALLVVPVALLTGLGFAAIGMAATTWMRSWQDFEYVTLALIPMFLFSATFYPLSVYPEPLRTVVQISPLYHAAALTRQLTVGAVDAASLVHVAVLVVMGVVGVRVAAARLQTLLLR